MQIVSPAPATNPMQPQPAKEIDLLEAMNRFAGKKGSTVTVQFQETIGGKTQNRELTINVRDVEVRNGQVVRVTWGQGQELLLDRSGGANNERLRLNLGQSRIAITSITDVNNRPAAANFAGAGGTQFKVEQQRGMNTDTILIGGLNQPETDWQKVPIRRFNNGYISSLTMLNEQGQPTQFATPTVMRIDENGRSVERTVYRFSISFGTPNRNGGAPQVSQPREGVFVLDERGSVVRMQYTDDRGNQQTKSITQPRAVLTTATPAGVETNPNRAVVPADPARQIATALAIPGLAPGPAVPVTTIATDLLRQAALRDPALLKPPQAEPPASYFRFGPGPGDLFPITHSSNPSVGRFTRVDVPRFPGTDQRNPNVRAATNAEAAEMLLPSEVTDLDAKVKAQGDAVRAPYTAGVGRTGHFREFSIVSTNLLGVEVREPLLVRYVDGQPSLFRFRDRTYTVDEARDATVRANATPIPAGMIAASQVGLTPPMPIAQATDQNTASTALAQRLQWSRDPRLGFVALTPSNNGTPGNYISAQPEASAWVQQPDGKFKFVSPSNERLPQPVREGIDQLASKWGASTIGTRVETGTGNAKATTYMIRMEAGRLGTGTPVGVLAVNESILPSYLREALDKSTLTWNEAQPANFGARLPEVQGTARQITNPDSLRDLRALFPNLGNGGIASMVGPNGSIAFIPYTQQPGQPMVFDETKIQFVSLPQALVQLRSYSAGNPGNTVATFTPPAAAPNLGAVIMAAKGSVTSEGRVEGTGPAKRYVPK